MSEDLETIFGEGETAPAPTNNDAQATTTAVETQTTDDGGEPQPSDTGEGQTVPLAALQAERGKAKRYTEEVADLRKTIDEQNRAWQQRFEQLVQTLAPKPAPQPQPKPADFWEAPETAVQSYVAQAVTPLQQMMAEQREQFSQLTAVSQHGQATVDEALAELKGRLASGDQSARAEYQRIMSTPHPYGALVEWHKQQRVLSEIGTDTAAYREKIIAEYLASQGQQGAKPAGAQPQPALGAMPSNFATARNVGSRSGPAWSGPPSLEDIFDRRVSGE